MGAQNKCFISKQKKNDINIRKKFENIKNHFKQIKKNFNKKKS
jgi:hypothetical protein